MAAPMAAGAAAAAAAAEAAAATTTTARAQAILGWRNRGERCCWLLVSVGL